MRTILFCTILNVEKRRVDGGIKPGMNKAETWLEGSS